MSAMGMASMARSLLRQRLPVQDDQSDSPQMGMNPNQIVGYSDPMSAIPGSQPATDNAPRQPGGNMMRLLNPTSDEQAYQQLLAQGPSQHGQGNEHGLGARLKDWGQGMILNAAAAPEGQKGMALLGGGIAGAVSPQWNHNLRYNTVDLPLAQQKATASRTQADAELKRKADYAKIYGYDPDNPEQATAAEQASEDKAAANEARLAQTERNVNSLIQSRAGTQQYREKESDRKAKRDSVTTFNGLVRSAGGNLTDEQVQDLADRYDIDLPDGYSVRKHDLRLNAAGKYEAVDRATGTNAAGQAVTSYDTTKEAGRNTRAAQSEAGKNARQKTSSTQMIANPEYDRFVQTRQSMIDQARKDGHPNPEGYAQRKLGKAPPQYIRAPAGAQQNAFPPLTKGNLKAGGTYTHQGKRIKVNVVNPDGTFSADVIP